jgi:hypothetical protein
MSLKTEGRLHDKEVPLERRRGAIHMNTPRSRPLERYSKPKVKLSDSSWHSPEGKYEAGLLNGACAQKIGEITTYWPQLEEMMIQVLARLLGDPEAPARQVFHSMYTSRYRVNAMRALLTKSRINEHKGKAYDDVIDEFENIGKKRNDYVHGLWYTHTATGTTFLAKPSDSDLGLSFLERREVPLHELESVVNRMNKLVHKIIHEIAEPETDRSGPSPAAPSAASHRVARGH